MLVANKSADERALTTRQTLRHVFHHGLYQNQDLHRRLDVPKNAVLRITGEDGDPEETAPVFKAKSRPMSIQRLADRRSESIDAILHAGRTRGKAVVLDASAWTVDEIAHPNVTDKETVLSMGRIAANAYVLDDLDDEWRDVGSRLNYTDDFGWDDDGLRGHVFIDADNTTVIIGIKGTSPAVFDGTETTTNDKINDNLFFSCCCGQGGLYSWRQVCDCQTSTYKCNTTCVQEALREKNRYYYAANEIYRNVTALYPHANMWLVGHSLGGATSSLVALTHGVPVVTFEAPGDAMAASRLGLPTPPGYNLGFHQQRAMTGGFHFGHTADPIYTGSCNTLSSTCSIAGYAMQSVCHTGLTCSFDTVGDFGWRSGIGYHRIKFVLTDVLGRYDIPAECQAAVNCTDCYSWEFYESHDSEPPGTTSTSTSTTTTRTSTCKTPGWWGCLDESTTAPVTTSTSAIITTATTTCETPGWWGCKDEPPSNPTYTIPTAAPIASTTESVPLSTTTMSTASYNTSTTCVSPGWLGCQDAMPTTRPTPTTSSSSTSTTCETPGWFGCNDPTTTAPPSSISVPPIISPPPTTTTTSSEQGPSQMPIVTSSCKHRHIYGPCKRVDDVHAPAEGADGDERRASVGKDVSP